VPGAHAVSLAEPTGQKVPTLQVTQSAALVINANVLFACVPARHGSGAEEPSTQ